jgi:hypothetical protein
MISVVCVYDDHRTFSDVLLKSLDSQTTRFELIALDNIQGEFQSAAQALDYGGAEGAG